MNILVLNYEFPPLGGGASPVSYEISKGYAKLGHTVDVVTMGFKNLPSFEKKEGMNIYRVPCIRSKKEICHPWEQLSYILSAKKFLRKHMKKHHYDVCHCHFIIPTGVIALWLKKKYGLKYIITAHGSDVPGYNPDRFKALHTFTKPFLKKICENAKAITVPSKYLADLIKKKIIELNIKVIPNGSKDYYNPKIKKENIIMSSGRLLPRKGFQYLINAFNELNPKDWKLYIVGDGPHRSELEKLAEGNEKVIFTGWLDNNGKEYSDLLNKAKIFALLSSRESQGIVTLEALSTGCSLLLSTIPPFIELKKKIESQTLFANDSNEVKNKLQELIALSKDEDSLKDARHSYLTNFSYQKIIRKYLNELEKT